MPIPSPADFRDKTKKHSQVREMMAQFAGSAASKEMISNTGFCSIAGAQQSNINYITETKTLEFKNTLNVSTGTAVYSLTTPQNVNLPVNTVSRIEYEIASGLISAVAYGANRTEGKVVLGFVYATADMLKTTDFAYTVNGLDPRNNSGQVKLIPLAESNINYKTSDRTLNFLNTIYVVSPTSKVNAATPISIPLPTDTIYRIEYNPFKNSFRAVVATSEKNEAWLLCGHITASANGIVTNDFEYTVNGVSYRGMKGDAKIVPVAAANVTYDKASRILNLTGTIAIYTPSNVYSLTTPLSVSLSSNTPYRLEFSPSTNSVRAVGYNATKVDGWLNLGFIHTSERGIVNTDLAILFLRDSKEYVDGGGCARILGALSSNINYTTVDRNLNFSNTLYVVYGNELSVISTPQVLNFPSFSTYRIEIERSSGILSAVAYNAARTLGKIVVGFVTVTGSGIATSDFLYTVNGSAPSAGNSNAAFPVGYLLATNRSDINFDFVAKTLTIADQKVRYLRNGQTSLLSAQSLDLSGEESRWHTLVIAADGTLQKRVATLPNNSGDIIVGQFFFKDQQVIGIPYYTVNGKPQDTVAKIKEAEFIVPYGNVEPNYEQPLLPSYSSLWSANSGDYNKFYALYDAILEAHPNYVTKTTLGEDALGNPIHQYRFSTPEVATVSATSSKHKIVLISGIHGGEKSGMYNIYFALKEIAERWQADSHLEALYWGVNFIVLPCVNPSGYNANTRWNHNMVDLARNFPADWSATQPNSGVAPLSEPEAVIIDTVMSNNKDALYLCSHHNFGDSSSNFIWNASATYFSRSLAKNLVIGQTIRAKKRYAWMPQTNDYYIGYADLEQPPGSEGRQAVDKYGINSSSFEISSSFAWEDGTPSNSSAVATIGVETFINWLLMNVKYAPQLYNTRINL